jgi:hypothetical protein
MMEGDPLGSTTASPGQPRAGFGGRRYRAKMQERSSYLPNTSHKETTAVGEREKREKNSSRRAPTHISTLTWLLLVGVLLPPGTYRVARARACVCVVLRHQQRVTYDEKMEGQQQAAAAAKQPLSGGGWAATAAASSYTSFYYFCTAMLAGGGCRGSTGCARVGDVALFRAARSKALLQKPMPI